MMTSLSRRQYKCPYYDYVTNDVTTQATVQVPLLMRTLDDDGDGHVSFEEFRVGLQDFLVDPENPGRNLIS